MNIFGKITELFIKNKQLSILLFIGILLWGGGSFWVMPKQYNPDIVAPAFAIQVDFPNATVDEVHHLVTQPLEDVLNEIKGVENIYSRSYHGGKSLVIAEFFVGEDLEKSMILLRQRIASRVNLAPIGAGEPYISSIDPEDLPIKTLALYSAKLSPVELRKRVFEFKEDLKLVEGAARFDILGGRKREIRIALDPVKMQASKTTINEIQSALEKTSLLKDLGFIKTKDLHYAVETQEQARTAEAIKDIVITSNYEGFLHIKDVANVIEAEEEIENYVGWHQKGKKVENTIFISISKLKGRNIIDVSRNIDKRIEYLKRIKPYLKDVDIATVSDEGRVAREEVNGLVVNLIQAILIVFVVLLGFLNYRAAIIVAASIPLTLLTVLAIGNLFGYTINRITLFALILCLGLLVDSATVVIENIVRNKKENPQMPKEQLVPQSVSEVGMGLFMSTVTTVLAFIPMLFVTGMMGPYMGPIPFFVSAALIVSLVYAYSLNPWMAYIFCKDTIESGVKTKCGFVCQLIDSLVQAYKNVLSDLIDNKNKRRAFLVICFLILLIVFAFPLLQLLRFRMLPKADREQIYVYLDLNRGASVEESKRAAEAAITALLNEQQVVSIQSFVGVPPVVDFNGLYRGVSERSLSHQITLKVNLTPPDKRDQSSEQLAYRSRQTLEDVFKERSDIKIKIVEDPPGPPVKATFLIKIKGSNQDLLYAAARDIETRVKGIHEVKDVDVSFQETHEKYVIYIDKPAVARAKLSVGAIIKEIETLLSGRVIATYHSDYNLEQEYVVLRVNREFRDDLKDLLEISLINDLGNHVALSQFIRIETQNQEDIYLNDNRERVVYISGEMGNRSAAYAAMDMLRILSQYEVPAYKTQLEKMSLLRAEYLINDKDQLSIAVHGEWDLTIKVFRDLGLAMLVAIILIYLVLVAQFQSFMIPFLIMMTIPLALIGVIPGFALLFYINQTYFSATSMIGVIALAGIVVNNAIILMEYINQIANKYDRLKDVLVDAGLTRMRPIMLTSLTTVLGSLVIATDPVWSGLAWALVFGLSLSTVLTLLIFPLLISEFLGDAWFKTVKS